MDTMVLLVGDSRRYEQSDCAYLHNLAGVLKQVQVERLRLHAGGDALKIVPVNLQFYLLAHLHGESMGGTIQ